MPPPKKDAKRTQDIPRMTVRRRTRQQTSAENTLSLSCISGDTTAWDQQYTRLKSFITESIKPYDADLKPLLFPVFIHVYLEVLNNGHKMAAYKFLERHGTTFTEESQLATLQILKQLESPSDAASYSEISEFRDNKYIMKASQGSLDYLMHYLKNKTSMIILQIVNKHIQINVEDSDDKAGIVQTGTIELTVDGTNQTIPPCKQEMRDTLQPIVSNGRVDSSAIKVEVKEEAGAALHDNIPGLGDKPEEFTMEEFDAVIKAMENEPPGLPSILTYTVLNTYQGLTSTTISPDNIRMAGTFEDSSLIVWSLEPHVFSKEPADTVDPSEVPLSCNYIFDPDNDKRHGKRSATSSEMATLKGHRGRVFKANFMSTNDRYLLSCSSDRSVRLWDMNTQVNTVVYQGHNWPVWDCCISPSDTWFASCCHDTTAKLWSFERTYPLRSFVGHTFDVDVVLFHPNGSFLGTASGDKTVRFWNISEGRTVRLFQGHRGSILAMAFSPDGKLMATGGDDRRVKIWDIGSGSVVKELRGHTDVVYALSFNENSSTLASGGADGCIRLWDVKKSHDTPLREGESSPDLLAAVPSKHNIVMSLKFTPYNLLLTAGS